MTRTDDGFLKLEPLALLEDVIALSFETGLPKRNSEEFGCWLFSLWSGLAQILMRPSRQMVRIDSLVNTRPERGSACTRWATRGESFGTSRILGEGWRTPVGGHALSQCAEGLPPLNVGEALEGWRSGTTISSSAKSHSSNWVSYGYITTEIYAKNKNHVISKMPSNNLKLILWPYLSICCYAQKDKKLYQLQLQYKLVIPDQQNQIDRHFLHFHQNLVGTNTNQKQLH